MSESHARRDLNWLTPVGAWLAVVWLIGDLQRAAASHWGTGPAWTPGSLLPFDLLAGTGRIRFDGYRYLEIGGWCATGSGPSSLWWRPWCGWWC